MCYNTSVVAMVLQHMCYNNDVTSKVLQHHNLQYWCCNNESYNPGIVAMGVKTQVFQQWELQHECCKNVLYHCVTTMGVVALISP